MFSVGDQVRLVSGIEAFHLVAGHPGEVVAVDGDESYQSVCVAFAGYQDGHDGDTGDERFDCRWVGSNHLTLVSPAPVPLYDDAAELTNVPIRLDADNFAAITRMAKQCGLTPDQMASALFVMAYHTTLKPLAEAQA